MDVNQALYVPSPYILTPNVVTSAPLEMVMAALYSIDNPDNPYWKTPIGSVFLAYQRCVISHFWRSGFDSKFIGVRVPRQAKEIHAEAELWHSVLRLLERMQTLCFLWNHPAILLGQIISERALVMANVKYVGQGEIGSTKFIKQLQSQNRILEGLDNPFSPTESPTTYRVIQKAINRADALPEFRKTFYMQVVKNRMSFVTCLNSQNARCFNQKKMTRQGRKRGEKRVSV